MRRQKQNLAVLHSYVGTPPSYDENGTITLTATPDTGWQFDRWSDDCSGSDQCVVNMTSNKAVSAVFSQINDDDGLCFPVKTKSGGVAVICL